MKTIKEEKINQKLRDKEFLWEFEIEKESVCGIEITASAKSWWQNLIKLRNFFKDNDLAVIIDEISFSKTSGKRGFFDSEVAWNGNNLRGLKKTNLFLIKLQKGTHTLKFLTDQSPNLKTIRIYQLEEDEEGRPLAAQGIFQLTNPAIDQLSKNKNQYHFEISDPFNIEQNIEAGLRYLKWLFDTFYKDTDQSIEKLIGAYNQGQKYFPPNEPLNYSLLPTEEKQREVKQITQCVLENKKRKNWKTLFLPIFFLGIFFTPFGMWYLNEIDFFEPVVSEKEYLLAQVSSFPNVFLERDKNQIIFFNSQKEIFKRISAKRLNLEKIFQVPEDFKEWNLIHLYPKLLQGPNNNFYFLAATSYACGAQNCAWVLYRYDFLKDKIEVINKDIFGSGIEFYPSPDFQKLALISFHHGGYCNGKDYLEIIDLNNFQKEEINGFHNDSFSGEYIKYFKWENDEETKFEVGYYDCLSPERNIKKIWIYNLVKQEFINF